MLRRTEQLATRVAAGSDKPDPVLLELFNNLFMNVAEQTGAVLQNTSMSVNIKERLDFSCAIFDARGLPGGERAACPGASGRDGRERAHRAATTARNVEAGRRGGAEQSVQRRHASAGRDRDNAGVRRGGPDILFFVGCARASRRYRRHYAGLDAARVADAGGGRRGIDDFLLVDGGHFREAELRALLRGAKYPARSPDVNVADIKAQVAANEKGVQELRRVVAQYGWPTVSAYMRHVMDNAEESVRRVIERLGNGRFNYTHG